MIEQKDYLKNVVGIDAVKRQLTFYIKNFESTRIFKNLLVVGAKGVGKTYIIRETARHLTEKSGKIRKFIEVNCSSIKDLSSFMEIISEHVINSECTIYLDETEELDKSVSIALLSILEINQERKTKFVYNGETYEFDFRKLSFIFSTTDPQKMLSPLIDRLEVVNLPAYNTQDLALIVSKNLQNIKFEEKVLENLASVTRGNPRSCIKLTDNIKDYLSRHGKNNLSLSDCQKIFQELSIYPLGLNQSEIQLLQVLKNNQRCSLTRLAAVLGNSAQMIRRFDETFLLKNNLMEICPSKGRNLTCRGIQYLNQINKELTSPQ